MSEACVVNGYELERDIKIGELADSLGGVVLKEEIILILGEFTDYELKDAMRVLGRLAQELNNPAQNNLNFAGLHLVTGPDDEYDYDVEEPAAHYNAINFATELCSDAGVIDLKESQVPLLLDVVRALYLFENNKLKATDRKFDCLQKYLNGADELTIANEQGITLGLIKKYIQSIINVIKIKFTNKELQDAFKVILDLQDNVLPQNSKSYTAVASTISVLNIAPIKDGTVQVGSTSTEDTTTQETVMPTDISITDKPLPVQVVKPSGYSVGTDYCSGEKRKKSKKVNSNGSLASDTDLPVIIDWDPLPVYTFYNALAAGLHLKPLERGFDWQDYALCSETDPELFFPDKGGSNREAKNLCNKCQVKNYCLKDALNKEDFNGIRGGLSGRERKILLKTQSSS